MTTFYIISGKFCENFFYNLLGVILFILLSGLPPFFGRDDEEILNMVKARKYSFDSKIHSKNSDHRFLHYKNLNY